MIGEAFTKVTEFLKIQSKYSSFILYRMHVVFELMRKYTILYPKLL